MVHTPGDRGARGERRSYLAAPPLLDDGEPEGSAVFREVPSPAGLLLHAALRDLMLWIETPPTERASLFPPRSAERRLLEVRRADLDPLLATPLLTLAALPSITLAESGRILDAVRSVAAWARLNGCSRTHLEFVQASALLHSQDSELALEMARAARDIGQIARAETWFRRVVHLSRGTDWRAYTWAYAGLGVLYMRTNQISAAGTVLVRALNRAEREGHHDLAGIAHHHLLHVRADEGRITDALTHASGAKHAYTSGHPALPVLVYDLGRYWVHVGEYSRAVPLISAALPRILDPGCRVVAAATLARAAAGAGDRERYESARERALDILAKATNQIRHEEAMEAIAHADLSMREWERAEKAAHGAETLALQHGHTAVLEAVAFQKARARSRLHVTPHLTAPEVRGASRRADQLGRDLLALVR
jgi:tetratricopeptide (TPR) repeat protein